MTSTPCAPAELAGRERFKDRNAPIPAGMSLKNYGHQGDSSVRIIRPGIRIKWDLRKKSPDKCFISARTKGDISTETKGFFKCNCRVSVTVISSNLKTLHSL